mgnify:FL=1
MSKLPHDERETHINMNSLGKTMQIYTTEKHIMRRLDRYVDESPNWKVVDIGKLHGEIVSKTYEAQRDLLLIRKQKRVMSEEQRQKAAERLRAFHNKKNEDVMNPLDDEEDFGGEEENDDEEDIETENGEGNSTESVNTNASSGETPRLEPQKSKPKYVKVKSVIDEMDRGR